MSVKVPLSPKDLAEGEELDFETVKEAWNEYKLGDGSTLRVKLVVSKAKRLKKHKPDGEPIYIIQSTNILNVKNIPKKLYALPKEAKETERPSVTYV